jgi:hypothetical protein
MLPTTALVMFETYFGHRWLSVRRRTLKFQQWGTKLKYFSLAALAKSFYTPTSKTMVPPLFARKHLFCFFKSSFSVFHVKRRVSRHCVLLHARKSNNKAGGPLALLDGIGC